MKSGDFVYIEYTAKVSDSGEIFDTTKEDVAKEAGIFNERIKYGPLPIIIDAGFTIAGLNEAVKEMEVGEKKKVLIPPEKAFGERNEELVRLIPEARFKEQDVDVIPGSYVMVNNLRGKIISVDGGRVKVDFNHPLAGKSLEYEIEVVKMVENKEEKVRAIVDYFTGLEKLGIKIGEKDVEIELDSNIEPRIKAAIASQIIKWIEGIETVKFVEIFKKSE
ncbi:MAG: FKBP-type peptidyl-prolyl cis-trans isomerase [Candidatus Aenigmatarchaeota archaeon]